MKQAPTIVVLFIALLLIAATPRTLTVYEGETLTLSTNTGSKSATDHIEAEFSIPRTTVNYYVSTSAANGPTIRQQVTFDIPPGDYDMRVRTWVNNELTGYDTVEVEVSEKEGTTSNYASRVDFKRSSNIHIEPIPDVTPGTTLILPIKISGDGYYTVEIPRLDFGTYETPQTIYVEGEQMIPVLIHVDEEAQPGTYAIPIKVGAEETTARLRIIKYQENEMSLWWLLVPLGIGLVVIGILLLMSNQPPAPPKNKIERVPPPGTTDDKDLITYY